jgi:hypothetical protein
MATFLVRCLKAMTDKRWKRQERQVAVMLGTTRNPNNGTHQTDIDAGPFAVEHKTRKSLPTWLTGALRQARHGAQDRTPIVVLTEVRQGVKAKRYVILDFSDWAAWHGDPQEGAFG